MLLLRAGTHCHAPACINETLYNLDTGEVLCYNEPLYGVGVWPGSGQHFNEQVRLSTSDLQSIPFAL